jgi:hypothetical protein
MYKTSAIQYIKRENIFTATEARFLPNAPTKTDRLTPDYSQTRTPPDATMGAVGVICISCYHSRHRQNLIFFFLVRMVHFQSSATDIDCFLGVDRLLRM